jgi:hypothetical protein
MKAAQRAVAKVAAGARSNRPGLNEKRKAKSEKRKTESGSLFGLLWTFFVFRFLVFSLESYASPIRL